MNDLTVFIYAVFFFAVAGGTFAFMWKMTTISIESINKPVERRPLHPEMRDIESGEELLNLKQIPKMRMMKTTVFLLEND